MYHKWGTIQDFPDDQGSVVITAERWGLGIEAIDVRPIRTEADYVAALEEIDRLMHAETNAPEGDRLDVLVTLVEAWEQKHHQIAEPESD